MMCGGSWRNSVYEITAAESLITLPPGEPDAPFSYLGCFVDQKERDLGDDAINSNNHGDLGPAATVQMCANFCRDGQFRYAAVQYYSHCVRALALSVCKLTHANPRALPSVLRQRLRGIRRVGRLGVQHRVQW